MLEREVAPTQNAFLELKEERAGMQEGYRFLDEKRLILAAEILDQLKRYERDMEAYYQANTQALGSLQGAVARHGLEGLELYPQASIACDELRVERRSVLGVMVQAAAWDASSRQTPEPAVDASPEADACRETFAELVLRAARLAVLAGNLERLRFEYTRTARRARALEDVLLPEIDDTIRFVEAALEELGREEVVRVRQVCKEA